MNEKTETPEALAAILAEMRDLADHRAADAGGERPGIELLRSYADRIEHARLEAEAESEKRWACEYFETAQKLEAENERLRAPGNSAAMREALNELDLDAHRMRWDRKFRDEREGENFVERVIDTIRRVLTAPARNCDVGTADEQAERFMSFCGKHHRCGSCPLDFTDDIAVCEFRKEGGAE